MFFFAVSPPKNTPISTLKSEVSANPLASMAISVKDLQSVQLRKTEKVGKTMSAPIAGEITYTLLGNGKTILIFVKCCLFIFTISTTYHGYLLIMYIILLYFFSTGFPSGGGGNPITNASPGGFKDAKHDLIAELKMSHTVGGVSKLRSEQQKVQEEQEREQYKRFLAQFTMENFLEKVNNAGDFTGKN